MNELSAQKFRLILKYSFTRKKNFTHRASVCMCKTILMNEIVSSFFLAAAQSVSLSVIKARSIARLSYGVDMWEGANV